jgi:hypothetical protein
MTSNTHKIAHYAPHKNQHDPRTRMHATHIPHYHHENFHALTITSRTKTDQVALNDTTLSHTTPNQTQTRAESAPMYLRVDRKNTIFILSTSDVLDEAQ